MHYCQCQKRHALRNALSGDKWVFPRLVHIYILHNFTILFDKGKFNHSNNRILYFGNKERLFYIDEDSWNMQLGTFSRGMAITSKYAHASYKMVRITRKLQL